MSDFSEQTGAGGIGQKMIQACENGDLATVLSLSDKAEVVNFRGNTGWCPIHYAAQIGNGEMVTTYTYNLFGELTGIDYSDSTPDITYAYNRVGRLAQVTDVVGTRTFAYNATLDEVSETITGLYGKTLARTYTSTGFKGRKQGLSIDNVSHL